MKKNPCKRECPRRSVQPNCHSFCEDFLEWKAERDAMKETILDEKKKKTAINKPYLTKEQKKMR